MYFRRRMKPLLKSKSFISKDDLDDDNVQDYVEAFNRRLTRRLSVCQINVVSKEGICLEGGVKINFDFANYVKVLNHVLVDGQAEDFMTKFRFSKKAIFVVPMTNHETVQDLIDKVVHKFNVMEKCDGDEDDTMWLYERELSVSQQDVFFRRLDPAEMPLELFLLWRINGEKKSMVLTDHDLNKHRFCECPSEELEERLQHLNDEEEERIQRVVDNYARARCLMEELLHNDNKKT